MEWKAIETAPKDGTKIDIWAKSYNNVERKWDTRRFIDCEYCSSQYVDKRWDRFSGVPESWEPIYWMIAPQPPEDIS